MQHSETWYPPYREIIHEERLIEAGEMFHLRNRSSGDDIARLVNQIVESFPAQRTRIIRCDICGKRFFDVDYLSLHMQNGRNAGQHLRDKEDQVFYGLLMEEKPLEWEHTKYLLRKRV